MTGSCCWRAGILISGLALASAAHAAPQPVYHTGAETSFASGDDGELRAGLAWPATRFLYDTNGTLHDHLRHLYWVREADCADTLGIISLTTGNWLQAMELERRLDLGELTINDCNVSRDGRWRLPTVRQLYTLFKAGQHDAPFYGLGWLSNDVGGVVGFYNATAPDAPIWTGTSVAGHAGETRCYTTMMPMALTQCLQS